VLKNPSSKKGFRQVKFLSTVKHRWAEENKMMIMRYKRIEYEV
jgi:hypothetical protein